MIGPLQVTRNRCCFLVGVRARQSPLFIYIGVFNTCGFVIVIKVALVSLRRGSCATTRACRRWNLEASLCRVPNHADRPSRSVVKQFLPRQSVQTSQHCVQSSFLITCQV